MKTIYSSKRKIAYRLETEVTRYLGVHVHGPYHHAGMKQDVVNVCYDIPALSSNTYCGPVPVGEWKPAAADRNRKLVMCLNALIVDLEACRAALIDEARRLANEAEAQP